ncbi:hypothetical protein NPX13_g2884 [Xylaria arbuscula]|uniref:Uncharacterized protein n=1 Tax=Xylaria arbuscula TaxID=114810 RepID=A0A9W8NJU8_9PEZI|nr:hypothetical protein NPX13_g2884 [Xylaria arbuscula]
MPPLEDITEQEAYAEAWRYLHNIYKDAPAFQLAQRGTAPIEVAKLIGRIIQPFKSEDGSSIGDNSSQSPYSELTSSSSISGGDSEHESSSVARPGSTTPRASEYSAAPTSVASGSQYSPTPTPTPRGSVAPTLRGDNTFHPSTRYAPTPCGHYGNGSETPHAQATPAPGGDNGWGFSTPYGVEAPTPQGNYGFGSATPLPSIESLLSPHRQGMEPAPSASPYSSLSPAHAPTPSPAHAPSPSPVPALPSPIPHPGGSTNSMPPLRSHISKVVCLKDSYMGPPLRHAMLLAEMRAHHYNRG